MVSAQGNNVLNGILFVVINENEKAWLVTELNGIALPAAVSKSETDGGFDRENRNRRHDPDDEKEMLSS